VCIFQTLDPMGRILERLLDIRKLFDTFAPLQPVHRLVVDSLQVSRVLC
jgi:hypothetical protein